MKILSRILDEIINIEEVAGYHGTPENVFNETEIYAYLTDNNLVDSWDLLKRIEKGQSSIELLEFCLQKISLNKQ